MNFRQGFKENRPPYCPLPGPCQFFNSGILFVGDWSLKLVVIKKGFAGSNFREKTFYLTQTLKLINQGIGDGDTDNNEQMPSIATHNGGPPTVCYAIVPSDSLMFTWASEDTNWIRPQRVNDHRHTGNFAPAAGWKTSGGSYYSTVLYAGTGPRDLWFDSYDNTTGVAQEKPVLSRTTVEVKPNPASRRVVFSYNKPLSGKTELVIWDITGREVSRLRGTTGAVWNCGEVQSGVYFFRLQTEAGVQNGTVVVTH